MDEGWRPEERAETDVALSSAVGNGELDREKDDGGLGQRGAMGGGGGGGGAGNGSFVVDAVVRVVVGRGWKATPAGWGQEAARSGPPEAKARARGNSPDWLLLPNKRLFAVRIHPFIRNGIVPHATGSVRRCMSSCPCRHAPSHIG